MVAERESWLPRRVLLCGVALCHAISLASLHAQLPGLLGADGILPLREALRDHPSAPGLAAFAALCRLAGCEPELLAGALCLAGAAMAGALAAACALRPRPGGALAFAAFAALHVRQLAIASLGSTFLSFQWEVLLLEATVVAAACALLGGLNDVMAWAPRLLLFKLMLCSGQAKLTSGCPTWVDLSALRYHFATQPLPTPLAWFAAQQPPRLLRLGTAVALALEGPMAALLLAPLPRRDRAAGRPPAVHHPQGCCEAVPQPDREPEDSRARAVGASLQLLLQAAIASTGNYTYFNLLTAVLALACFGPGRRRGGGGDGPAGAASAPAWPRRLERAASLALVSLAGVASARCFSTQPQLRLSLDVHTVPALLERYLPPLLKLHFRATLPAAALASAWRSRRRARPAAAVALGLLAAGGAAAVLGGLTAAPLRGLLRPDGRAAAALAAALPPPPPAWLGRAAEAARASSSYGLFRAMTGVGPAGEVARPELEFQGSASASGEGEGEEWHPIDFAYKPNGPPSAPRWVAPHQPRLDWQLWFAALGPPQRPPAWAAGLAARLLAGSADVWALLPPGGPFSAARPPARLRVVRWSLRFTTPAEAAASPGGRNWWVRSDPALWLAPVALGDPGLQAFLRARGWEGGGGGGEGASRRRPPSVGVIAGGLPWPCVAAAAAGAALVAAVCAAAAAAARGEEGRPCATSAARLRLARLKGE